MNRALAVLLAGLWLLSAAEGSRAASPPTSSAPPASPSSLPPVLDAASLPTYFKGKIRVKLLHEPGTTGSSAATLALLSAEAGAEIAVHVHEGSDELLYIEEGEGTMTLGDQTFAVRGGSVIRVPSGIPHSLTVTGTLPLRAIQVYAAAGPEQRFKKWEMQGPGDRF